MKISNLIIDLQNYMNDYGDVEVALTCESDEDERLVTKAKGSSIEWLENMYGKETVVLIHD